MNEILEKLNKQKLIIELEGYKVAYICIYGSQNYGLDINNQDYQSDIDMKAIIVPTLSDLINNSKPVSKTINTEWGQCDVKDIRTYFETLLKANPAYIETLYTNYMLIDEDFKEEFKQIISLKDELVKTLQAQFIRAIYGMMCEKEKALCHPYPSIAHKIEKFGFDGKQAHHIKRLWLLMQDYFGSGQSLKNSMFPHAENVSYLMDMKLNVISYEKAIEDVKNTMNKARGFKDSVLNNINENNIDYSIKNNFIELSHSIIKNKIIKEIRGE